MWPTCRAVSSRRWYTAQRNVVGRRVPAGWEIEGGRAVEHGVDQGRLGPVEGGDLVHPPALGQLEHVGAPGHIHGLPGEDGADPEAFAVAQVDDEHAERVGRRSGLPAQLFRAQPFDLVERAIS